MISNEDKQKIIDALMPLDPKFIGIFGSYARNEENESSDIDILVEFKSYEGIGLNFFGIQEKIKDLLARDVDMTTPNGIRESYKESILEDIIPIYEAQ